MIRKLGRYKGNRPSGPTSERQRRCLSLLVPIKGPRARRTMSYPGYPGYGAYPYYPYPSDIAAAPAAPEVGPPASVASSLPHPATLEEALKQIASLKEENTRLRSEVDQLKASKASASPALVPPPQFYPPPASYPAPPQPYSAYPNYGYPPAPGASTRLLATNPPRTRSRRWRSIRRIAAAQREPTWRYSAFPTRTATRMCWSSRSRMGTRSSAALRAIATAERHEATRSSRLRRWPRPSG